MSSLSAVTVLVYEGFEPLDAIGPYEVFSIAAGQGPGFDVSLRTVEPADRVEAAFGLTVEPDGTLAESDADLVVVPGGGWNNEAAAGARAEAERGTVPDALTDRSAAGDTLLGVCTGGMLLARAGVLDGRPAVTHAGALDDLRETEANVVDARVVDAGSVVTTGGVTAGIDGALYLLEREFDARLADSVAEIIEHNHHGPVHTGD